MGSDGQPAYDTMGRGYRAVRQPDPRLASKIATALGDSQTVVNVGAGAGSYEPVDRWVLAVEPSSVMIAQRPPEAAPVLQTTVQDLRLADRSVDAGWPFSPRTTGRTSRRVYAACFGSCGSES
jgi:hypothetical protein